MKGIITWGGSYFKLLKQQLADDSRTKIRIRDIKTKSIQDPAFCFSLCFTFFGWLFFPFLDLNKKKHQNRQSWIFLDVKNTALIQGKGNDRFKPVLFVTRTKNAVARFIAVGCGSQLQ